ncbi:MAG: DUF2189 domain-containing protein [Limnohabitans sp.]|nr:MAG: DUF2189 domain-containing protein [Limnohabitans sp.]
MSSHTPPGSGRPAPALLPPILAVEPDQPLRWLVLGFRDLARNPWLSMAHGLAMTLAGWLITWLAFDQFWVLVSLISGFMVGAPVLATSLYAMSRAMERGEEVNFALLVRTWTRWQLKLQIQPDSYWALIRFGLLLALAAAGWVFTSSAFIHLMAPVPIHTPMDFIRHVVASQDHRLFEIWLALGSLMAAPLFASSVVSMPMLLDRRVTVLEAVLTSWKAVLTYPVTMALWAFLLMAMTALGIFSLYLGLILVVPLLGHASWHAYRELVDVSEWPPRLDDEGQP